MYELPKIHKGGGGGGGGPTVSSINTAYHMVFTYKVKLAESGFNSVLPCAFTFTCISTTEAVETEDSSLQSRTSSTPTETGTRGRENQNSLHPSCGRFVRGSLTSQSTRSKASTGPVQEDSSQTRCVLRSSVRTKQPPHAWHLDRQDSAEHQHLKGQRALFWGRLCSHFWRPAVWMDSSTATSTGLNNWDWPPPVKQHHSSGSWLTQVVQVC